MSPNSDENMFISSNGHLLRIHAATKDDGGQYECVAENPLGIISKRFEVQVNGKINKMCALDVTESKKKEYLIVELTLS